MLADCDIVTAAEEALSEEGTPDAGKPDNIVGTATSESSLRRELLPLKLSDLRRRASALCNPESIEAAENSIRRTSKKQLQS